jgi:hypothetical protein
LFVLDPVTSPSTTQHRRHASRNISFRGGGEVFLNVSRSIRPGRKQPFFIVLDPFGSQRITAVFYRVVNERKRWDTQFSGRLRQLLNLYDMTKDGRNTVTIKWSI